MMPTKTRAILAEGPRTPFRPVELELRQPGPDEVVVRISASGINPLDLKIRAGVAAHARHPLPAVLGLDMAGTVIATGPGESRFRVGDEVYGMIGGVGGLQGSLAEYATVDANLLARKPTNIDMRAAAALPLVVITAWEGLIDRAQVNPGDTVLVHGGAGGVGRLVVQMAIAKGARVFATGSAQSRAAIESMGATAIDYLADSVEHYLARLTDGAGFDIIYDTVGGATLDASFAAVRHYTGRVVSCLGWGTHALAPLSFRGASYSGVFTLYPLLSGQGRTRHGEILAAAAEMVESGQIKPHLDPARYTLATTELAYAAVDSGAALGKVVVEIA
ncbi:NADPH:quinone reductase-like Zn-dependent oxidoreductase [Dongia mobilis]|uniref:NADPH:quinone reductase-like Zn-dependent oxidoreductase n=1 Tax=Dongia mobilis TaxID=578943 RepID=A0A4R6WM72_9PROT|nr:zinc-dependent alcohol dehydrogenase family protein [Dongia mobilis]TDQ82072.1 NADPH:quinone reductase-like Zn-dependent oxidoreductase [Dongia mobilis]